MQNQHIQRSTGYSGIAFVLVAVGGALLPGIPPDSTAPGSDIAVFLNGHRTMWMLSTWLALPALAFFLWFAAGLNTFLRTATEPDEALLSWGFSGAIAAATMYFVFSGIQCALIYHGTPDGGSDFTRGGFDVLNILAAYFFAPFAIFVGAASLNARRHHALPSWLSSLGFVAVGVDAIGTLAPFFRSGPLAPGALYVVLGFFVPMIWIIAISFAMIRTPELR